MHFCCLFSDLQRTSGEKMKNRFGRLASGPVLLFLIAAFSSVAFAQQTIVNVPSTEVLDQGKVYVEFDSTFKFDKDPNNSVNKFSSFVPRVVVGIGNNTEVGVNLIGNIQPGSDATTLMLTAKVKLVNKEHWSVVGGTHVYIPVRNKSYNVGNYAYLQASRDVGSRTRMTAGAYHTTRNVFAAKAQRAGGQFAIEHTLNGKFTVGADWITGKHAAGYFSPVLTIRPVKKTSVYLGYSIGNADVSRGNHFFYVGLGYIIN
jgi:hypothetical protein